MTSDVHVREITIAFVLALCAMVGVFFACGDDDDDDDNDDDENNLPATECDGIMEFVESCAFPPDLVAIGQSESCFGGWCTGAGYDSIGWLANYDFNPSCFSGSCQEVYDNFTDAGSPVYDECYSTRFAMRGGVQCTEPSYY